MTNTLKILLKIGGSLCKPSVLSRVRKEIDYLSKRAAFVILPGGGPFADMVRGAYRDFKLDEDNAHWMAIAAMEQYGMLLQGFGLGVATRKISELLQPPLPGPPQIFLPYDHLHQKDPLPHSWNVTSDTIAAYLTGIIRPDLFVLLKPLDGLRQLDPSEAGTLLQAPPCEMAAGSLVDSHFCHTLPKGVAAYIINGNHPERLAGLVLENKLIGSKLIGEGTTD